MKQYIVMAALLCLMVVHNVRASDSVESAGDVLTFVLPATAAGLSLGLKDNEGLLQLGKSGMLTLGVTFALKHTINEQRPDGGSRSFPSGHTSVSFASAEFLRKRYGWQYGIPAYAAAAFVGYSRIEADRHYVHDVIAGMAVGVLSSYLFTRPYQGWNVQMAADSGYCGVCLCRRW